MMSNNNNLNVCKALSTTRMRTYLTASNAPSFEDNKPLELYSWNAEISAAFLFPLHILEVVMRNAVSEALTTVYGANWPQSNGFMRTLPNNGRYNPRNDLTNNTSKHGVVSKIIPELKFVFWEKMFTSRFDGQIWATHFNSAFPNANKQNTIAANRAQIAYDLTNLRKLRNRIAHHEPIFSRNLQAEYDTILNLIEMRCNHTSQWMDAQQKVTTLIPLKP